MTVFRCVTVEEDLENLLMSLLAQLRCEAFLHARLARARPSDGGHNLASMIARFLWRSNVRERSSLLLGESHHTARCRAEGALCFARQPQGGCRSIGGRDAYLHIVPRESSIASFPIGSMRIFPVPPISGVVDRAEAHKSPPPGHIRGGS